METEDPLPEFLKVADIGAGSLYLSSGSHWTQITQMVTSELVTQRLARYPFVQQALKQPKNSRSGEGEVHRIGHKCVLRGLQRL